MFVSGKSRTAFFPTDNLIDGISCDGSKNFDVRTCEHMILGQLRMGARQTKNAPLALGNVFLQSRYSNLVVVQTLVLFLFLLVT